MILLGPQQPRRHNMVALEDETDCIVSQETAPWQNALITTKQQLKTKSLILFIILIKSDH